MEAEDTPTPRRPTLLAAAARGLRHWAVSDAPRSDVGRRRTLAGATVLGDLTRGVGLPAALDRLNARRRPEARAESPDAHSWAAVGAILGLKAVSERVWVWPEGPLGPGAPPLADWLAEVAAEDDALAAGAWGAVAACLAAGVDLPEGVLARAEALEPAATGLAAAQARLLDAAPAVEAVAAALHAWGRLDADALLDALEHTPEAWERFRFGRQRELVEAAQRTITEIQARIAWDYQREDVRPEQIDLEGRVTGPYAAVTLSFHTPYASELPYSWSHPRFRLEPCDPSLDPYGLRLHIEIEWGARDARHAWVDAAAIEVDPRDPVIESPGATEPVPEGLPAWEGPHLAAPAEAPWAAPSPHDAWLLGAPPPAWVPEAQARALTRLELLGVDLGPSELQARLREARGWRLDALPHAEGVTRARLERELAALTPSEPPLTWIAEARAEGARYLVARAFGAEPRGLRLDAGAAGGSRVIADPIGRAAWAEHDRIAALAGDFLREHTLGVAAGRPPMSALLPDPEDRARLARAAPVVQAQWAALERLALQLSERAALDAEEAEAIVTDEPARLEAWRRAKAKVLAAKLADPALSPPG